METVSDLITALGGNAAVSRVLDHKHASTVSEWRRRGSIPVEHWPRLVEAAAERGIRLTYEQLVTMHVGARAAPDIPRPVPAEEAAA